MIVMSSRLYTYLLNHVSAFQEPLAEKVHQKMIGLVVSVISMVMMFITILAEQPSAQC